MLKGCPVIFNNNGATITIGDNVIVKSSFLSNLVGLSQRTIIVTRIPEAEIVIGNNVGISGATIYARKGIYIGDNTSIGGNCKILDNDFHPIEVEKRNALFFNTSSETEERTDWIKTKPIYIGKNCFIGTNTIILKGTELGEGCVVGAGAILSGKFPPNSIIVGNPGKVIRTLDQ